MNQLHNQVSRVTEAKSSRKVLDVVSTCSPKVIKKVESRIAHRNEFDPEKTNNFMST